MAQIRTFEVSISAGSQFLGTEFLEVNPSRPNSVMVLKEVDLAMGGENKTWDLRKTSSVTGNSFRLLRSLDPNTGLPAANSVEDVVATFDDIGSLFEAGDVFAIVTSGATNAMRAKVYFLELEQNELVTARL